MASGQIAVVYRQIGRLFGSGTVTGLSEGQLLDRFVARRDDEAFRAIVARHGPMVLSVCRSILRDPNDVDDAFQAVFLILVRRADSLCRRDLLGGWLHGVARRVARRALVEAMQRRDREGTGPEPADKTGPVDDNVDVLPLIHEEVNRLPESYREAVVLCYFQGRSHEEAAQELGWPVGTVKGRLARARDLLRDRLTRRGLTVPSAAVATVLAREGHAAVAPSLITMTTSMATALASGSLAAGLATSTLSISPRVIALAQGVLQTMSLTKLKLAATLLVATSIFSGPAVSAFQFGPGSGPARGGGNPDPRSVATADQKTEPSITQRLATEQEKLAEKAISTLEKMALSGESSRTTPELLRWRRRLMEARIEAGSAPAEAIGAYIKATKTAEDFARKLHQTGSASTADIDEAEFQRLEAEKLLANLKSSPVAGGNAGGGVLETGTQIPAAGGGGFGGGKAGPAGGEAGLGGGGLEGTAPRTLPKQVPADSARNKIIEKALEQELKLTFPKGTPLTEIFSYIRSHTQDKQAGLPKGIPIYMDPLVLVDETVDPPGTNPLLTLVPIDFEDIPLRVSLRLILDQYELAYQVRDRLVYVNSYQHLNFMSEGAREFVEATGGRSFRREGAGGGGMGGGMGGMGGMMSVPPIDPQDAGSSVDLFGQKKSN
jgi:RNA polymerase sigma factor (sigma-70 family)